MTKRLAMFTFVLFAVYSGSVIAAAQNKIDWSLIGGPDNEFGVYIPNGYLSGGRSTYYLADPASREGAVVVDREINIARYLNGILFRMDYWEGDAKKIEKFVRSADADLSAVGNAKEIGAFTVQAFAGTRKNRSVRAQYFGTKKHFYRISTDTSRSQDRLVRAFFQNARILGKDRWIIPNAPEGATSTVLPKIVETQPERLDDAHPVDIKDVDRPPLLLTVERLSFSSSKRHNVGTGAINVKVMLSSNGTVTKTEIVRNDYMYLAADAIEAAKRTVFIPAEKDGKLVSVSITLGKSFEFIR